MKAMKAGNNPLSTSQNIHMVGIGGSGMSALAKVLREMGKNVTGSDQNPQVQGQTPLPNSADLLIYSQAVPRTNAEIQSAQQQNIPIFSYPQAVGFLTREKRTIAVCGTHGKTTTTALLAAAFENAGQDPTVMVGAAGKSHLGKGDHLILEACEYQQSFLNYQPSVIVLTNMEHDHVDAFPTFESYQQAFRDFLHLLSPKANPVIIANGDDPQVVKLCEEFQNILFFGTSSHCQFRLAKDSTQEKRSSHILQNGKPVAAFTLKVPGDHNKMNALAAYAAAVTEGLDPQKVLEALQNYTGSARRFETIGKIGTTPVLDDYAHHPTEIAATLSAAREKFGKTAKILCVFQPHQYSRTAKLLPQFAAAFTDADEVIVPDIYAARDTAADKASVSAQSLADAINEEHKQNLNPSKTTPFATSGGGQAATIHTVRQKAPHFDVILFLGAGTITNYAHEAIEEG